MTPELASGIVDGVVLTFASGRIDLILQGFTEDAEIRFGSTTVLRGRNQIKEFLEDRFAERADQRLDKRLRAVDGDALAVDWRDRWTDTTTDKPMHSEGTEFWTLRDGLLSTWEIASTSTAETDLDASTTAAGSSQPYRSNIPGEQHDHIGSRRDQHRQP
ncbi:nuclear transport factor 2 family protein [Pseudonocardia sp. NPDC049154]|uniref:nuclear transport factor 2 family protein n=1 Tax=Pseudonocardia sp. NPDC049154 TaxID=3155501 RepID=UPI0033C305F0